MRRPTKCAQKNAVRDWISVDSFNHYEVKLIPLVIRFFTVENGVRVCILDLRSMPRGATEDITNFIFAATQEDAFDLKQLTFCADNALVNFGGPKHDGQNNVFYHFN